MTKVWRHTVILGLLLGLPAAGAAAWASEIESLRALLDGAVRTYDTAAATEVLSRVRSLYRANTTPELTELHLRSSLAVAELLRVEMEWVAESEPAARRTLGQRIDATAREGLELVPALPESSERWRMGADLLATLIRSDFRAKKHEKNFKEAAARALEIDDRNARAWVSNAKPYLFAPPDRGRDLGEAVRLLNRALDLEPDLESARLLRALAYDELGNTEFARADWQTVLDNNPTCKPARRALAGAK
jgi:tetratricopeptide (TPR) repeat protein